MKHDIWLMYFLGLTLVRGMQFIQLTCIAASAVALSAERDQRPKLHHTVHWAWPTYEVGKLPNAFCIRRIFHFS